MSTRKLDDEATRRARELHAEGVARLNAIFGLTPEMIAGQDAYFARQVAKWERKRSRAAS